MNLTTRTGSRTNATVDVNTTAEPSTETTVVVANATVTTGTVEATVESYWEPRPTSCDEDLKLFLHLFEPASGALSKRKPEQWEFIRNKILPKLSEAALVAKEQENRRRLIVAGGELNSLSETEEEPEEDDTEN